MYYRRLGLDDFGVFQGARMDDLDSGLIVIVGPQRAGKSTFMEALRRWGYGIGQGDAIPPASDSYRLDAEIVHADTEYRLGVNGYSAPTLTQLSGTAVDGQVPAIQEDVFGGLSREQYQQLYTLSLYQLQRLPPSIEDPEDLSRVLLGAAYGSIADLPDVKAEFASNAHDIGRTKGHPRYGKFSDAYERIEQGQKDLKAANEQVEKYNERQDALEEVQASLDEIQEVEADLDAERRRLNTVLQYFDEFHTYRRLRESISEFDPDRVAAYPENGLERATQLADDFETTQEDVSAARTAFESETDAADPAKRRDALLDVGEDIDDYETEISGWDERVRGVQQTADELRDRRHDLEAQVSRLKEEWSSDLEAVKSVQTDLLRRDAVVQAVEGATEAQETVGELEAKLEGKREREAELKSQLKSTTEATGSQQGLLLVTGAGLLGIFAAIGLSVLTSPLVGIITGGITLLVGTAIAYYFHGDGGDSQSQRTQLQAQKHQVDQDIAELEKRYSRATDELTEAQQQLQEIREKLGLGKELSPEGVWEFYDRVIDLQEVVETLEREQDEYHSRKETLEEEFNAVATTVHRVQSFEWDEADPLEHTDAVFSAINQAATEFELAVEWAEALEEKAAVEADIQQFVGEWDMDVLETPIGHSDDREIQSALRMAITEGGAINEFLDDREECRDIEQDIQARFRIDAVRSAFETAFAPSGETDIEAWCLDAFAQVANQFTDASEIESRLEAIEEREAELDTEREECQTKQAELRQELEQLASEDDLLEARREIQQGKQTIERLGEEYATYRIAEYIAEELQDRFIEETTGPLLEEASEIFATITADYDGVDHTGELENLDFRVTRDGEPLLDSSELSRATAEQLFMSVRLARIRQIDASLPVVLDDALTNFDPAHSARTIGLINELAQTNQVFFLTAHPAFVELIAEYADVDQYWRLDDGRFEGPFTDHESAAAHAARIPTESHD